jgi:hypothetical protein
MRYAILLREPLRYRCVSRENENHFEKLKVIHCLDRSEILWMKFSSEGKVEEKVQRNYVGEELSDNSWASSLFREVELIRSSECARNASKELQNDISGCAAVIGGNSGEQG